MDIRLISVDLDKTLLRDDETVSQYTLNVLGAWKKSGAKIVVSTSRSFFSAKEVCDSVCPDAVISSGGVEAFVGGKRVYSSYLSCETAKKCIMKCISDPFTHHITVVGEREDFTNNPEIKEGELEYGHYRFTDFSNVPNQRVGKISVFSDRPDDLSYCFSNDPDVRFIPFCIGVNGHKLSSAGANKGDALTAVAEHFSILKENIISFGDDTPDVDMFRASGISVAMGNSGEEVRAAADRVCDTNENDGVARFLEALLPN